MNTKTLERALELIQGETAGRTGFCLACRHEQPAAAGATYWLCRRCGQPYVFGALEIILRAVETKERMWQN